MRVQIFKEYVLHGMKHDRNGVLTLNVCQGTLGIDFVVSRALGKYWSQGQDYLLSANRVHCTAAQIFICDATELDSRSVVR